jgi:BlaI family penicillinase repressor
MFFCMRRQSRQNPRPTEFELELLKLLWEKGGATVRDLFEVLNETRSLGYTTILKTLQIMTEKGLVYREEVGKAHLYHANRSERQTKNQLLSYVSENLFSGSAAQLVLHALSSQRVNAEELARIKQLIAEKEAQR